jgi:hypothetical protein
MHKESLVPFLNVLRFFCQLSTWYDVFCEHSVFLIGEWFGHYCSHKSEHSALQNRESCGHYCSHKCEHSFLQCCECFVQYSSHKIHCQVSSNYFSYYLIFFVDRQETNLSVIQSSTETTYVQIVYKPLKTKCLYYTDTTLGMSPNFFTKMSISSFQTKVIYHWHISFQYCVLIVGPVAQSV